MSTGTGGSPTGAAPGTPSAAPNHGLPGPAPNLEDDQGVQVLGWIAGALVALALVSLGALLELQPGAIGRRLHRP